MLNISLSKPFPTFLVSFYFPKHSKYIFSLQFFVCFCVFFLFFILKLLFFGVNRWLLRLMLCFFFQLSPVERKREGKKKVKNLSRAWQKKVLPVREEEENEWREVFCACVFTSRENFLSFPLSLNIFFLSFFFVLGGFAAATAVWITHKTSLSNSVTIFSLSVYYCLLCFRPLPVCLCAFSFAFHCMILCQACECLCVCVCFCMCHL